MLEKITELFGKCVPSAFLGEYEKLDRYEQKASILANQSSLVSDKRDLSSELLDLLSDDQQQAVRIIKSVSQLDCTNDAHIEQVLDKIESDMGIAFHVLSGLKEEGSRFAISLLNEIGEQCPDISVICEQQLFETYKILSDVQDDAIENVPDA